MKPSDLRKHLRDNTNTLLLTHGFHKVSGKKSEGYYMRSICTDCTAYVFLSDYIHLGCLHFTFQVGSKLHSLTDIALDTLPQSLRNENPSVFLTMFTNAGYVGGKNNYRMHIPENLDELASILPQAVANAASAAISYAQQYSTLSDIYKSLLGKDRIECSFLLRTLVCILGQDLELAKKFASQDLLSHCDENYHQYGLSLLKLADLHASGSECVENNSLQ